LAFWHGLTVRTYQVKSEKIDLPTRWVVLTDLHDSLYGPNQSELIEKIREQKPDYVLFVGDIADEFGSHSETKQLLTIICREYRCFYVTGNHEYWSYQVEEIEDIIRSNGVTILEGNTDFLQVNGQKLSICGVDDPDGFDPVYATASAFSSWQDELGSCQKSTAPSIYSILLSHRPELVEEYIRSGFDLVLAGHAHGGQIRIPGILNGLYAPDQGFFPKYAGGRYPMGGTTMIVSRGLSLKKGIPRIFNPPELVVIDLEPIE
ncbi:MAG: metallophosphoesterase, partial [Anaerolineaceae bacterium]|nr:metallophosphoesterase [Anaerolineaceae bacterium]